MLNYTNSDREKDTWPEPHRVRRVKSRYFTRPSSLTRLDLQLNTGELITRRLMRILFESPMEDYLFVRENAPNQDTVICCKKAMLRLAMLRVSHSLSPLRMLEIVSTLCHPNVADVLDAYYHEERLYIVSEYLEVSLLDVDFNLYPLEEWEIATIIAEVNHNIDALETSAN
jgi:hypothetical protein